MTAAASARPRDLVIVGGGITGAGIARDAALRGLHVTLVEKRDLGSGTSSKSSKLVHGGLRYLEHGELRLVFEGTNERSLQMRRAPHLVRPIPFLVPIYKRQKPALAYVDIGLWIYDALAMFRSPKLHKTYRGKKVQSLEPALRKDGLAGALEYYDCLTDDARLVLENALDARALGAEVRTYTRALGVLRDKRGRVAAVRVRDELGGGETELETRAVVVAAGPWTDVVLAELGIGTAGARPLLRPTKGVHVVVDHARLPVTRAVTLLTGDRRVIFCIPWGERTLVGTTDTDFSGHPDEVYADAADVAYLCESVNRFFPDSHIAPADVLATWAGLRPLIAPDAAGRRASDVSREHEVFVRDEGVVIIAGGKLTTYRRMAKEATDRAVEWLHDRGDAAFEERAIRPCGTKNRPLPGAHGLEPPGAKGVDAVAERLRHLAHLDPRVAQHLSWTYGMRAESVALRGLAEPSLLARLNPDLPYLWAEVDHAVDADLARTVEDVLVRRVPLCLRGRDQGLDVAEAVAQRMGTLLGWPAAEQARQVEGYRAYVAGTRRFRSG
jgi:glycerol-3-phosphate dehydrogenase